MHVFIETWTPNERWAALPEPDRRAFMDGIRGAISDMAAGGIATLGWGTVDDDTPHRLDHTYVAIWQAPTAEAIRALEDGVQSSGWYEFFDQVNVRSELRSADDVMDEHIAR